MAEAIFVVVFTVAVVVGLLRRNRRHRTQERLLSRYSRTPSGQRYLDSPYTTYSAYDYASSSYDGGGCSDSGSSSSCDS
jgi:hypothetical protein